MKENPENYICKHKILVIGVNCVKLFIEDIKQYLSQHIELHYDLNGGNYIACQWLTKPNLITQELIFNTIWEIGNGVVESIEVISDNVDISNKTESMSQQLINANTKAQNSMLTATNNWKIAK